MATRKTTPPTGGGTGGNQSSSGQGAGGGGGKPPEGAGAGARHIPKYYDTEEDYVSVRRGDLREIADFGWLEQGAGAAGMFFLSGAFWLALSLLVEHSGELSNYWAGFVICGLSMLFGAVLVWVAHRHFRMRENRINDYFKGHEDKTTASQSS